MKILRPIMGVLLLALMLVGTAQPAAAATITFTSGPPTASVEAYTPYPTHFFTATGDTTISFTLASGSLPTGTSLSSTTGRFAGTPTTPGSYTFTVRAVGSPSGDFADQTVTVTVTAPVITITSGQPPSPVTAYEPYPTHTFTATGGTAPHVALLVSGSLPTGTSLSSTTGRFAGTPITPGTFTFVVRMRDANGFDSANQTVTVVVVAPTITITSGTPTSPWFTGQPYPTHTFTATGGTAPYAAVLVSGSLPIGMALSSTPRTLAGTPITPGTYTFVVRIRDANGFGSADQSVTIVIADPDAAITSGDPPKGTVGTPYSFTFTATGDSNIAFSVSAGALPPGLTLAPGGALSGTPTTAGSFEFTVKATGTASSDEQEVTLVVDPAPTTPPSNDNDGDDDNGGNGNGNGGNGNGGLPVTGSNMFVVLLVAGVAIALGGVLLIVTRGRIRRFRVPE